MPLTKKKKSFEGWNGGLMPLTKKKCKICSHEIEAHYFKLNGKIIWGWEKDKFGRRKRWCSCRACEERDAIYGEWVLCH
jgi:hypothetical protein